MDKEPDYKNEWVIGLSDEKEPEIMTFSIPFKKWADDEKNGRLLMSGFFDIAKSITKNNMLLHMKNKHKMGVINPSNGKVD